jgi:hypothetical protein
MIKFSLLCFYWRLFSVKSRLPIIIAGCIVVCWTIATVSSILEPLTGNSMLTFCRRWSSSSHATLSKLGQWDVTLAAAGLATCISRRKVYLGASIPNVITDLFLIILPIPYVWSLHASVAQRLILAGIFSLGCFVAIVSVVRLSILMRLNLGSSDVTFNLQQVFIRSIVEVNVGLVCACLPSLKPAIKLLGFGRLFPTSQRVTPLQASRGHPFAPFDEGNNNTRQSKRRGLYSVSRAEPGEEEDSYQMIGHLTDNYRKTDTHIGSTERKASSEISENTERYQPVDVALPGIRVDRSWQISEPR